MHCLLAWFYFYRSKDYLCERRDVSVINQCFILLVKHFIFIHDIFMVERKNQKCRIYINTSVLKYNWCLLLILENINIKIINRGMFLRY